MILIDAVARSQKSFDACLQLAEGLAARGHKVVMDENSAPADFDRSRKFAAAGFLADLADLTLEQVILLGGDEIADDAMAGLRKLDLAASVPVAFIGRFADHQARVSLRAKIAYALGREPQMVDMADMQPRPLIDAAAAALVADTTALPRPVQPLPRLTLVPDADSLSDLAQLALLAELDNRQAFSLRIITSGEQKDQIRASRYHAVPVVSYSELSPMVLAQDTDITAFFGQGVPGERMAGLAVCLMAAGGVVIDGTSDGAFVATGAPALRGPDDLAAFLPYLTDTVLINLGQIGSQVAAHSWCRSVSIARLEAALGLTLAPKAARTAPRPARTLFLPTNGVGLGHAQRCTVIAAAMPKDRPCAFAAFPSCLPMIAARGFDCTPLVQKSEAHTEPFANDLANYLRLQQILQPGDGFVFDGGYVFDSIYRSIVERQLSAIWIRRGLWPQGMVHADVLDRERIFDRVIVPSEAFDELSDAYSFGNHIHTVGPIFRHQPQTPKQKAALRAGLAKHLGRDFDELVVTMLGGGVASDRSAQLQTLCAIMERRPGCLHLIVVWPGSTVLPALQLWQNTRVVQTTEALALSQASDLTISAAGYNSVNEILYHQIPAILMPQWAPYLDDQTRRARAAADRGLSICILENELLLLEREVTACLDGGKAALLQACLGTADLPPPGTKKAAQLIAAMEAA
ncbi:MAG: glycosyltransferase [Albidovulum sp.]